MCVVGRPLLVRLSVCQSYDVNRDVVCQLQSEAGHPPKMVARLKKFTSGMNDVTRRWWNVLYEALRSCGMFPTRADQCCSAVYSLQSRKQAWEHGIQGAIAQQNGRKELCTFSRE